MRNSNAKDRSPLTIGGVIFIILATILIICCAGHFGADTKDTAEKGSEEICTTITTSVIRTTSTRQNTTTSTAVTSTKTTSETTTLTTVLQTEVQTEPVLTEFVMTEPETQPAHDPEPVTETPVPAAEPPAEQVVYTEPLAYSESDAVLLAQLINKESSATWDGMIAVADCVVNRANVNGMSISQVIYAPEQFTTAYSLGYYTADNYNAAVQVLTYGSTNTSIYFFDGNHGGLNWFYDKNRNYLFAA
ncbi:cell wall hydrolase [Ruminococcus sp.]|uniref:cell wall hydrolase n=1 Tax=Ruminococcus sp. TaxID=41978 RepID=UPI001B77E9E8|nr:cell wall hydrolase [Ruminococcus sp.]MBP5433711.1 cell wall hydrolase [Ruminococcus sp.]